MVVGVFVDDLSIAKKIRTAVEKAKEELKEEYEMTDGGEFHDILGMQVHGNREIGDIFFHQ